MNKADPRTVRTDEALIATILRLASSKAVEELSIQEVCRGSGVSRTSFYRRATTPAGILSEYLNSLLLEVLKVPDQADYQAPADLLAWTRDYTRRLTAHLVTFGEVYAQSFATEGSALRILLRRHLLADTTTYIEQHRSALVLPSVLSNQTWDETRTMLVHHYVCGYLGLAEAWLATSSRDPDVLTDAALTLAPGWNRRLMDLGGGRMNPSQLTTAATIGAGR